MNSRLKEFRKSMKMNQKDFAKKINMSQTGYASIETGANKITERTIKDIIKEYNINEEWLRYGTGEIYAQTTELEKNMQLIEAVLKDSSPFAKNTMIALASMDQSDWNRVENFIRELINKRE